jgi:sirohydrochlorin cobaltochelatase
MMTPGGEHAEIDIPAAISRAQQRYPNVDFRYAWPFESDEVALFLSTQVARHV